MSHKVAICHIGPLCAILRKNLSCRRQFQLALSRSLHIKFTPHALHHPQNTSIGVLNERTFTKFLKSQRLHSNFQTSHFSRSISSSEEQSAKSVPDMEEDDKLYKWIELRTKGHDDSVLESYATFVSMAAEELGVEVESVTKPRRDWYFLTLLRSRHIYKKHRVQYELRTYFRVMRDLCLNDSETHLMKEKFDEQKIFRQKVLRFPACVVKDSSAPQHLVLDALPLKHLTGSTADVLLEYIERNLPEGVAMQVKTCALEKLPEHLLTPPESLDETENTGTNVDQPIIEGHSEFTENPKDPVHGRLSEDQSDGPESSSSSSDSSDSGSDSDSSPPER